MKKKETCQNCQKEFVIEQEDFDFYEKMNVPAPTWCFDCRLIRKMIFRNNRALYKRKCDAPGHEEEMVSIYSSDKKVEVYDQKYWQSDNWDSLDYGRDYDFSQPFFEQFKKLFKEIPKETLEAVNNVNCHWVHRTDNCKNCYKEIASFCNEDSAYNTVAMYSKEAFDNYALVKTQLAYDNYFCQNCFKIFFSKCCFDCQDTYFSENCFNCSHIIGCTNLRHKKYHIFDQPVSKKGFEEFVAKLGSFAFLKDSWEKFQEIRLKSIFKYNFAKNSADCTGDFIENSKKCINCFTVKEVENSKFILGSGFSLKDSYDVFAGGFNTQSVYEFSEGGGGTDGKGGAYNILFSRDCTNSFDIFYSHNLKNCNNCFGCVALKHKQYCILNKQYTKKEYEELVPKIIEHMNKMPYVDKEGRTYKYGEFFPPELSLFCYNETVAQEYFPLTKKEAIKQGYSWKDLEKRNIKPDLKTEDLPDNIKDVKDDILDKVIQCAHSKLKEDGTLEENCNDQCTTAFKIISQELDFYRKMNLPLPRLCPNCRYYERIKRRNPLKTWKRKCMCQGSESKNKVYKNKSKHFHGKKPCPNEFETPYSPERKETIYCEKCYNQEVA